MTPDASHFIDGQWAEDTSGSPIPVVSPATGETIATYHAATRALVERAVTAAARAQTAWAATPPAERGRVLRRAADLLRARNQELSELETLDTGKPLSETLVADAASGADALEYFGGLAATLTGEQIPFGGKGGDFAYTVQEPLGVCVGIGAWNYPIQIACWKAAPALAAGNAMVFKPSEITPMSALRLAEIFIEAGAPAGLFNVIQGYGDTGALLTTHPGVAKVSLTGSVPTGAKVASAASAALKPVTMELGGKSPLIVFDDASIEDAVSGAILGNFYSSGQICSNGTRVFVQRGVLERFTARLLDRLNGAVIGDPMDPATTFGPLVTEAHMEKVLSYIQTGITEGARLLTGGTRLDRPGFYVAPTVFTDVADDLTIAREEIFGPVLSILPFDDETEVIPRANATPFGLAAGVFTSDLTRAHRVIAQLEAGTCWINTYNLTPVEMPFGAVKHSGFGRENARAAIAHYTSLKTVYVSLSPVEAPF